MMPFDTKNLTGSLAGPIVYSFSPAVRMKRIRSLSSSGSPEMSTRTVPIAAAQADWLAYVGSSACAAVVARRIAEVTEVFAERQRRHDETPFTDD
jgi:hypothetical protein